MSDVIPFDQANYEPQNDYVLHVSQDNALAEAERILADAEPLGRSMSGVASRYEPLGEIAHNERAALAEGLAGAIVAMKEMS